VHVCFHAVGTRQSGGTAGNIGLRLEFDLEPGAIADHGESWRGLLCASEVIAFHALFTSSMGMRCTFGHMHGGKRCKPMPTSARRLLCIPP
jgi:hypothetical protein